MHLPREEGARSCHQRLFEEHVRKTRTCGLRTLSMKSLGVVFMHEEGISTPRFRHKGRQPSIKCANMTSKLRIFPFMFLCIFSHSLVANFLSFLFSFSHSLIGNFLSFLFSFDWKFSFPLFFAFSLIGNFPSLFL